MEESHLDLGLLLSSSLSCSNGLWDEIHPLPAPMEVVGSVHANVWVLLQPFGSFFRLIVEGEGRRDPVLLEEKEQKGRAGGEGSWITPLLMGLKGIHPPYFSVRESS